MPESMESNWEYLLHITRTMTSIHTIEDVLSTITKAAFELMTDSDTVILYLHDDTTGYLHFVEGLGVRKDRLEHVAFSPDESLTGHCFRTRTPYLCTREEMQTFMTSMKPSNKKWFQEAVYHREIKSSIAVPLVYHDQCLGVLVVNNFETEIPFTIHDRNQMQIMADHSAIAIMNSRLIQSLKEKNQLLNSSLSIHKDFTRLVLEGSGPGRLLQKLEQILQQSVHFYEAQDPVSPEGEETLYSIVHSKEYIGCLELEQPLSSLSEIQQSALEHGGTALALEMLKARAVHDKELALREEWFEKLLTEDPLYQIESLTRQMGWNTIDTFQVMVIEGRDHPLWEVDRTMVKHQVLQKVEQLASSFGVPSFVVPKGIQVIMVMPAKGEKLLSTIIHQLQKTLRVYADMAAGIGRETPLETVRYSFQEAKEAVSFAKTGTSGPVVRYADLGFERFFEKLDRKSLTVFVEDKLGPLLQGSSPLYETLRMYISCNQNHKKTADSLHIHPNTLYYRLNKIQQQLQLDFSKEKDWMDVRLAVDISQWNWREPQK
ncbi:helix-turn-helix domain-containing protein [Salibacterium qingdaonense]|uniref:DNA-binding transcriptional regulator, PucR family n=1 Tax=Salibacterium qingdaonense TaxID=266892 RepID=A0A1I4MEY6_9BACI|nr:helix-turn-helix domain-containing protein [Salibacterium qingdaonense]SFM01828.1 DNA-binding transcriptional regulator, PucR family [Salibacterium qingdaonense]